MKALILRQSAESACAISKVLIDKGFQILCVETLAVAHALIRVDTIDLLVMDERFDGQLTHAIALSGERRSPYISSIMLTDRDRSETDDLYDLIPCLYALAGMSISPHILGQLALAAVSNVEDAIARVQKRTLVLTDLVTDAAHEDAVTQEDDSFGGDPSYADIAIADPELAELTVAHTTQHAAEPHWQFDQVVDPAVAAMMKAHPFLRSTANLPEMTAEPA